MNGDVGFSYGDYNSGGGLDLGYLQQPTDSWISGAVDTAPAGWGSSVGPQTDGTYAIPQTAQLSNAPQNNAGYSSSLSPMAASILQNGIGILGKLGLSKMQIDYARAEATNGGLFWQGRPALLSRNGYGAVNQPMNLSVLLLLAGGAWLLLRK